MMRTCKDERGDRAADRRTAGWVGEFLSVATERRMESD
jgi:hypothetical protein